MKKFLIALALGAILVLALATVASADNGPHGSFTATTDACASCHRAHTAKYGSNSLLIMAPDLLCLSCHNGAGAGTNVVDGVYNQGLAGIAGTNAAYAGADAYYTSGVTEGVDGASLFGGGFDNALMATAWSGATTANPAFNAVSKPTTSHHNYDGTLGTVWGSGANNSAADVYALECVSCHDPHGTAGWVSDGIANDNDTRARSYRLLRWQPAGSNGFTDPTAGNIANWTGGAFPVSDGGAAATVGSGWLVPDNFAVIGTEWYTIGTTGAFAAGDYNAGNANNVYNLKNATAVEAATYIPAAVNTAMFCAQCHDRYFNNSRSRNNTDVSMYCGSPVNATTPPYAGSPLFLPYNAPVGGAHPVDPIRCEPVYTGAALTGWGDNGDTGDTDYMFRHASGDIRISEDGSTAAGTGATVSRSCVACHTAHGTTSAMTAFASDATMAAVAGADVNNSTLLRMDNRSLCLRCHATTVNFTVAP
jgi:predicted CXXCH cytochrome family protein